MTCFEVTITITFSGTITFFAQSISLDIETNTLVPRTKERISMESVGSVSSDRDDSGSLSETGGSRLTEDSSESDREQLAQKETRIVFGLRLLVILVLLLAAIAVSVVVYYITRNAEVDEFETQYKALADTVLRAFEDIVTQKLGALSSLSVAVIAHGADLNQTWPFVTLSAFQPRSATARSLSGAVYLSINPIVSDAQRAEWEEYVVEEAGWITEGFEYQDDLELDDLFRTVNNTNTGGIDEVNYLTTNGTDERDEIFYVDEQGENQIDYGPGPYLPGKFSFTASQHSKVQVLLRPRPRDRLVRKLVA
jgi:hypothetical protein